MNTKKLYYEDAFLCECEASVIGKNDKGIITNQTVAFAEGGGQEGDIGIIQVGDQKVEFFDTQKGVGRMLNLEDFPSIQVDTPVYHCIGDENIKLFEVGAKVKISINVAHRIKTTAHHSALHLALMAAKEICPEKVKHIKGCKITENYGRLDFFTYEKITTEEIEKMNETLSKMIESSKPIMVYAHETESEAWYWKCDEFVCACGGTHLKNTGEIGETIIKRKNVGKSTERLIVEVKEIKLDELRYHK